MDAVVQVEAAQLGAIDSYCDVVILGGAQDNSLVSIWTTVITNTVLFIKNEIQRNGPNPLSSMLVLS